VKRPNTDDVFLEAVVSSPPFCDIVDAYPAQFVSGEPSDDCDAVTDSFQ
jgi:hypothetical protein